MVNRFGMWNGCARSMAISYIYFSAWKEKHPKMWKYYCTHPYLTNSTQPIQKSRCQLHVFSRVVFTIYHATNITPNSAFLPTQSTCMVYMIPTIYGNYFPHQYESAVLCNEIARFEALTPILQKLQVLWADTLCYWINTCNEHCFTVPECIHLQGQAV